MSDLFDVHASDIHGGMHTGSGPINNNYYLTQQGPLGNSPRKQPMDELRWLTQRFVAPVGLGQARDILQTFRTVFLHGPSGSGRIAAAKALLSEYGNGARQIHELLLQEHETAAPIDHSHIGDGDLVWLDLSQVAAPVWDAVHSEISSLRATVHERDAYLVVALPNEHGPLGSPLARFRAEIRRPAASEVLSRYLLVEGVPHPDRLPALRFLDAERRMEEIPKYVALILKARDEHRDASFTTWCESAYKALSGQEHDVAARVAQLPQGSQRALMLAIAMLHEAHADVVHRAAADLLEIVEHPHEDNPLLLRAPLGERLKELGAELDSDGCVRYVNKLEYDAAVRSYFWTHMPELHPALRKWVKQTADSPDLTQNERANLIERFTEQCLNERYRPTLVALIEQLTSHPTNLRKMQAAALVLQRGLRDEKHGRSFRRQIYDWSRTNNLSDQLTEVITVACRDEMMAQYPDEALVRLHHVARRERGTRGRETLIELVKGARRLRLQMLSRLTEPTSEPGKWHRDVDLFLELTDPGALTDPGQRNHALIASSTVRRQLATGWSLVYAQRPYDVWAPRAEQWLHVANANAPHRDVMLDVLVRGAEGDASVLARLYSITREQAAWDPLSTLVLQKINESMRLMSNAYDKERRTL